MDKKQALEIIKQACGAIQATLDVHSRIQEAIRVVEEELTKKAEKK